MSSSLPPCELQNGRLPCPSLYPWVCTDSCPLSWWCHPTISSSVAPFFSCPDFLSIRVFSSESVLHIKVAKVVELQLQHPSFQWIVRVDFLYGWLVWSPCSPGDSQESSPSTTVENINSSALSLLYGPTLTSVHEYWKNHSFGLYRPLLAKWCF